MSIILTIIGIACFATLVAEVSGVMDAIKKLLGPALFALGLRDTLFIGRLKPFDCPMCLAWWLGLGWFLPLGTVAIVYAAICSILAIILSKIIYKL